MRINVQYFVCNAQPCLTFPVTSQLANTASVQHTFLFQAEKLLSGFPQPREQAGRRRERKKCRLNDELHDHLLCLGAFCFSGRESPLEQTEA